jgi:hypothetical protein
MDVNELLTKADQFLEENQYSEAARLFQLVADKQLPTSCHLMNWRIAEEQAQLAVLKDLARRHPDSLECHLGFVGQLLRIGMEGQASAYCTDLIDRFREPKSELQIRLLRLRAGLSGRNIEHVVEDFLRIWNAVLDSTPLLRLRSRLLRDFAAINDARLLPVLEELKQNESVKDHVGLFMSMKIEEINMLVQTTEALKDTAARQTPYSQL